MIDEFRVNEDGEIERFAYMAGGWSAFIAPERAWALAQAIDRDRANLKEPLPMEFRNCQGHAVLSIDPNGRLFPCDGWLSSEHAEGLRDWLTEHIESGTFGGAR